MGKFKQAVQTDDQDDLGNGNVERSILNTKENPADVVYIDIDNLIYNPKNTKGMDMSIDDLLATIPVVGLLTPLTVRDAGVPGKYLIVSGERRHRAFKKLFYETHDPKYRSMPCIVKDLSKIDLPIDPDLKEKYIISTPNMNVRHYTFYPIMEMIVNSGLVYDALKEANYDLSKFQSKRQYIARHMHISETEIHRYQKMAKKLIPELQDKLDKNGIGKMTALELTEYTSEQQQQFMAIVEETKEDYLGITAVQVKRFMNTGTLEIPEKQSIKSTPLSNSKQVETGKAPENIFEIDYAMLKENTTLFNIVMQHLVTYNFTLKDIKKANKEIEKIRNSLTVLSGLKGHNSK